jgi:phage terminase small subunit
LHVINGTASSRTVDDVAYTAVGEFPPPPQHLNTDGVQIWNDIGRELTACGVLQVVDLYALGQLAYMWQRHVAKAKLGADIISAETMSLRSLFAEFGMTPASRRRFISGESSGNKAKKNRFKKFKQDR